MTAYITDRFPIWDSGIYEYKEISKSDALVWMQKHRDFQYLIDNDIVRRELYRLTLRDEFHNHEKDTDEDAEIILLTQDDEALIVRSVPMHYRDLVGIKKSPDGFQYGLLSGDK